MIDDILSEQDVNTTVIQQFIQELPEKALRFGMKMLFAVAVFFVGSQIIKGVCRIVNKSMERHNADTGVRQFVGSFLKYSLYLLLVLTTASSVGFSVASVVALLGSAGVAIGLAVQGSLSNLAGGVLILLLKPFRVGDYIVENNGGKEGTVKEIQIFYTKLETVDNHIVVLPNGALANNSITNYSSCPMRRLSLQVGIAYSADIHVARQAILKVLSEEPRVLKDQTMRVFVDELGDSSVVLGIHCWLKNEDYWEGKWAVTEAVKLAMDEAGVCIPFPQIDVHLN